MGWKISKEIKNDQTFFDAIIDPNVDKIVRIVPCYSASVGHFINALIDNIKPRFKSPEHIQEISQFIRQIFLEVKKYSKRYIVFFMFF